MKKKMSNNLFGFLVIDKPKAMTSHDCVKRLRKILGIKRIGHGGTLDPSVTGVLPIAIGNATRLLTFLPDQKNYRGLIQLGRTTFTDDLEGEVIAEYKLPNLTRKMIEKNLESFIGPIKQKPPVISSIHIQGERAYKRARRGEKLILPSREVTIDKLQLINWNKTLGQIEIDIKCSSGTYIRSLARDIGNKLNCGGCLASLRRTASLGFKEQESFPLPEINVEVELVFQHIIAPKKCLEHLPFFRLNSEGEYLKWRTGSQLEISTNRIEGPKQNHSIKKDFNPIVVIGQKGQVEGIASGENSNILIPKIVFNAKG